MQTVFTLDGFQDGYYYFYVGKVRFSVVAGSLIHSEIIDRNAHYYIVSSPDDTNGVSIEQNKINRKNILYISQPFNVKSITRQFDQSEKYAEKAARRLARRLRIANLRLAIVDFFGGHSYSWHGWDFIPWPKNINMETMHKLENN